MAAIALTGPGNTSTAASGAANNVVLPRPANLADGQAMVAFVYFRNQAGTITPPASGGWAMLAVANTVAETFAAYVKTPTSAAAESSNDTYTFSTSAGSSRAAGGIALINAADLANFQHAFGALALHTGVSSVALPSVDTTGPNKTLLAFAIANNTTTGTLASFTPPAGMTTVFQVSADNGTSATCTIWMGQEVLPAAGSSGERRIGIAPAAANSGGFLVAVNGANVAPAVAAIPDQVRAAGSSATVTAVATDVDGVVTAHAWSVVTAPYGTAPPALTGADTATVSTGPLSVGTTVLQYVATDNTGRSSAATYARLLVPAASAVPVRAAGVRSNAGGWNFGGQATDLVDGVADAGKWIISPAAPTNAEITYEMEVPSTGTHTIAFRASWVEDDGTTPAPGVLGAFTAQVFRNGVAISRMYSAANNTADPILLTFSMDTADDAAMNTDLTRVDIRITANQGV